MRVLEGKGLVEMPLPKIKRRFQKSDATECRSAADNEHATKSRENGVKPA